MAGFSEVYGSWKTTWMSLLSARRSRLPMSGDDLAVEADLARR